MNYTKKRWITLIFSCIINLCIGSIYAWSVFSAPMAQYLSQITHTSMTAESLAIVFTVANAVGPITMIAGGTINDRLGPQRVILVGGLLFGGGMFLCSLAKSLLPLAACYGLGCGLGMGMVYGCTVGNAVKAFPDMRGLIGGIATATYGLSSVIMPPVATSLIRLFGVTGAFRLLGISFIVIICGASFFVFPCPKDFLPRGWVPSVTSATNQVEKNWCQMLITPTFYQMIIMLCCGAVSGLMMISQASPIAQNMIGLSTNAASFVVSLLALFNVTGRVIAGYLSDQIGRGKTLIGIFTFSLIGLFFSASATSSRANLFYIGIAVIGLCFGALMGIYPGFTADQFGSKHNTVNYGIMFIGFALAGLIGPMIMSGIYKSFHTYAWAFLFASGLDLIGLILAIHWQLKYGCKTSILH